MAESAPRSCQDKTSRASDLASALQTVGYRYPSVTLSCHCCGKAALQAGCNLLLEKIKRRKDYTFLASICCPGGNTVTSSNRYTCTDSCNFARRVYSPLPMTSDPIAMTAATFQAGYNPCYQWQQIQLHWQLQPLSNVNSFLPMTIDPVAAN